MRSVARYWPRSQTAGLMMAMYGGTKRTWNKEIQEPIRVSGYGYPAPIGRQEDETLYIR